MAAIGNILIKIHSSQTLTCTLQDTETVILQGNFSFDLNNFADLSMKFFIKCS